MKTSFFGALDHSKMHFSDFWMILHDLVRLPNPEKHLVPSQYAISSRSNWPNSRKWPKTSFLALWIIQKYIFVILEWPFMTWQRCQMLENIKYYHNMQYQVDPTDQTPENGQKPLFLAIWIIPKCIFVALDFRPFMTWQRCQMLENIQYYHIMQYQVHPNCQKQKECPTLSFSHFSSKNF